MKLPGKPQPIKPEFAPLFVFLSRHGAKLLALLPLVFLVWMVTHYAVAVPFGDQWELVPLLEKSYHGTLTLHDLWAQHNEHRIFFPQIIMLVLARLTGWNIYFELMVNIILALGIFAVFVHQVKMTERKLGGTGLSWAVPAISVVVFSVSQYQNWLWGWQLQMFLNLLAVLAGIVLLADETFRWRRFAAAAGLGIVATCSFANGMLFWPIGLVILSVVLAGKPERKAGIIAWLVIGTLTLVTWFYQYHRSASQSPLSLIFQTPGAYAAYVFKYIGGIGAQSLGGDVATDGLFAFYLGLVGILIFIWAGLMLVRSKRADFRTLLPYFGMSLYSVGSDLITGAGRLDNGSDQALASRYCTMMTPLWVSLIVFLILLARGAEAAGANSSKPNTGPGPRLQRCQSVASWSLDAVVILLALDSLFSVNYARDLSRQQTHGREILLDLAAHPRAGLDPNGLLLLYSSSEVVLERCPVLMENHLSVFRDRANASDSQQR